MPNQYTGPTGVTLKDGRLHIEGYPDAERVAHIRTPIAKRLADLRLHQATLKFCESAMQKFGEVDKSQEQLRKAMLVGIVALYFSCFGRNKASSPLKANAVFAGMPEAKECFDYWKELRDKHLIHNESAYTELITGAVLGSEGEVQDIISIAVSAVLHADEEHCQLLYNLIDHALKFVNSDIDALMPRLFEQVNSLSVEERKALPSPSIGPFPSDKASATRA